MAIMFAVLLKRLPRSTVCCPEPAEVKRKALARARTATREMVKSRCFMRRGTSIFPYLICRDAKENPPGVSQGQLDSSDAKRQASFGKGTSLPSTTHQIVLDKSVRMS